LIFYYVCVTILTNILRGAKIFKNDGKKEVIFMIDKNVMKNDLISKCEYIKDEKIDILIKMSFYRQVLIHILNNDNFKIIAKVIKQLSEITSSILSDCDSEHLIYIKAIELLNKDNISYKEVTVLSTLLSILDELYLDRSLYFKEYTSYLKNTVDEPKELYKKYRPVLESKEILDFIDNMMVK